jgi:predicted molibdopterin-dependent oxidoreductase YjgC
MAAPSRHRGLDHPDARREADIDVPTLCFLETLTPVNACRVCVVEVEGARRPPHAQGRWSPAW